MKIAVCASMRFSSKMVDVARCLEAAGHEVILPRRTEEHAAGTVDAGKRQDGPGGPEDTALKIQHDLMRRHCRIIDGSDAVLVVTGEYAGLKAYIGANTFGEVFYAFVNGKPIYLSDGMPDVLGLQDELLAMGLIELNGDLSPLVSVASAKVCDHTSVGMLVERDGEWLLIERKKFPFGFAPPAGHKDGDRSFDLAAVRELDEEAGLRTVSMELVWQGRVENPCRRIDGTWHYWKVYKALTTGELKLCDDETKRGGWYDSNRLAALARRTEEYLAGIISDEEWEASPGLEPVWYDLFKRIGIIF